MRNFLIIAMLLACVPALGADKIVVHGYNADVDTGTEDLWPAGGAYAFPAAAATTTILSSSANDAAAGTGARTVQVVGLDANFRKIQETATMNGTSAVTLTNSYLRILYTYIVTAGSGATNAGAIDVKHSSTVISEMAAAAGRSQAAFWTASSDRNGWKVSGITLVATNAVAGGVIGKLWTRKSGKFWQLRHMIAVYGSTTPSFRQKFDSPIYLDSGEDVRLEATSSADNTAVAGSLEIESN